MKTYYSLKEVLEDHKGKMGPKELWEKSSFKGDIDAFYAALKYEVEVLKQIVESPDKEYLTIVQNEN